MNSIKFLEAYQHLPLLHRQVLLIVLLTTSVNPCDLLRAQRLHIVATVNKPLTEAKVAALIEQYFPTLADPQQRFFLLGSNL